MEGLEEDFDWKPPSEAEMKVLQARRERSDKISKLMGDYLLKGYKMLGSCCSVCGTILLRDRQQLDYCVCCSELETDLAKDDPAVSAEAARSQVEEHELSTCTGDHNYTYESHQNVADNSPHHATPPGKRLRQTDTSPQRSLPHAPSSVANSGPTKMNTATALPRRCENCPQGRVLELPQATPDIVRESMEVVTGKLFWASQQLKGTVSVEGSTQLCTLIKACADTLTSLRYLIPGELTD